MKKLKVRISDRAGKGWHAIAAFAGVPPEQVLELMGQWFAMLADQGSLDQEIGALIMRLRAPQVVVANGDGAQAAGRDIVNATVEEHVVPPEHSATFVQMLLAGLAKKDPPPEWFAAYTAAREAQRRAETPPVSA